MTRLEILRVEGWVWVKLRARKQGRARQGKALYGFWELYFRDNLIVGRWD